jgi:hypothetical protein
MGLSGFGCSFDFILRRSGFPKEIFSAIVREQEYILFNDQNCHEVLQSSLHIISINYYLTGAYIAVKKDQKNGRSAQLLQQFDPVLQ